MPVLRTRGATKHEGERPGCASGAELMAKGPDNLFGHVASSVEAALGRPMPQLEVRYANVSLTAEIIVADSDLSKAELPTLANAVKRVLAGPKKHVVRKEILREVSGVFRPGTITLVLGQPGSGKSSLMKLLSGRFPMRKNIKLEGDITYNGLRHAEIAKVLPQFAAYVAQRDKHFASLTVKETLAFAHECCRGELERRGEELLSKGTLDENLAARRVTEALFTHYPDVVAHELGLQRCQDTIVGDTMLRGVSGGERKRVTIGEMEFGLKYASFMDEISTGLDSSAACDIVDAQRHIAHHLRKTVVIALLQPPPEVFSLFDDVLLMNEGRIMYHGPCDRVMEYFKTLGFTCPRGRAVADFLLDLGTDEQQQYQSNGYDPTIPRSANDFAARFQQSDVYQETLRALESPLEAHLQETADDNMKAMPEFSQSIWASMSTVLRRQLVATFRQRAFIAGRVAMVVVIGLLIASVFYKFDPTEVSVVLGVMFASIMFMSIGQSSQIPTFVAQRDIFYKQRGANFFRSSSFVLASSVCLIPMAIVESLVFGSFVYWICGFEADAGRFVIFELVLFLSSMVMTMWFFFLANAAPNANVATPLGMVSLLIFVIFAGFIVTKSQIPDYLIWAYWLSPITWSVRSLAVNQYRAPTFDVCEYAGVDYCMSYGVTMGEYYLQLFDIDTGKEWVVYGVIYLAALYVVVTAMSVAVLEYFRYETPGNVDVSKELAAEQTAYALLQTPTNASDPDEDRAVVVQVPPHHERNFTPITLAFQDLWYSVPDPATPKQTIDLLRGISGFAAPGTMTALMGSTGAGKTTLMDVIAGRKAGGKTTGRLLINGYPATPLAIQRCTGYCEQADIHCDATTIREALTFSAFLRQDSQIPDSVKFDSVNEAIELLGLEDIADQIVRGSSVEQMKRLTIGVELAAQPSVLFLDEPTSGLDARSAKLIMDGVRKVADSGRTIVCTIHQPSAEVFYLFDSLLLLKRGGQTVFFGELGFGCRNLIEYFEAVPGTMPLPEGYNPATWMLGCVGAGVNTSITHDVDFVERFNSSQFKAALDEVLTRDGVGQPSRELPQVIFTEKRAASSWTQMHFVVKRFVDMYWRTPSYNLTRIVLAALLALLFGLIFVGEDYDSYQGLNSGIGMVFTATLFNAVVAYQSVLPLTCAERASYYRERASQTYNAFWYFVGSTVAEIPYVFASSLVFTVIFYPMVGFRDFEVGVLFWLAQSLLVMMQVFMGQLFCYALPTEEVAAIIGVLFNAVFLLFMGFLPPANAIPEGYKWLYDISPHRYALSTMVSLLFTDCDELPTWNATTSAYEDVGSQLGCQPMRNAPVMIGHTTLKEYTEQYYGIKHSEIATNFAVVVGYIALFRLLALLALRFINHQKK